MPVTDSRRLIPGVDRLLQSEWCGALIARHGRPWVTAQLRGVLEDLRTGRIPMTNGEADLQRLCERKVKRASAPSLTRVVNATGVVLHTNLGRAPIAPQARAAMDAASGYGNVEFDLCTGARGSRDVHCAALISELTGAAGAVVTNNCAGALALALAALARGGEVVVSNGELVEIGGGFRIPEVIAAAGCRLRAVGTTNCTRLSDYGEALRGNGAGAILKVHRSNFTVAGFKESTRIEDLVALGAQHGLPVIHDLGSGLLIDGKALGLPREPTPRDSVACGVDLVAFSGDKLLGGPQAGILAGQHESVARARAHPLCRALRCDKVTLAGLEATLRLYRHPARAAREIPVLRMIATPADDLKRRARLALARMREYAAGRDLPWDADVVRGESLVGGGTFPDVRLPTWLLRIKTGSATASVLEVLRGHVPPIVARSRRGSTLFDFRGVAPGEGDVVARALAGLGAPRARADERR